MTETTRLSNGRAPELYGALRDDDKNEYYDGLRVRPSIEDEEHRSSLVARSFLLSGDEVNEENSLPPRLAAQVHVAINASLFINVCLATAKLYAAIESGSLAVLSSLVDSILDLTSQVLLCITDKHMHTPSVKYPAGRRRLEPIAVIMSATLMGMGALEVVQQSVQTLVLGFEGHLPELDMSALTIIILSVATLVKMFLWRLCGRIGKYSPSAAALAQDHRNDVFSNAVAIATSTIAHYHRRWWYYDSVGAIAISLYIAASWLSTGNDQVKKLVGKQADPDFVERIRRVVDLHHPSMRTDIVRAYHFGNNYLVEVDVIAPETMIVREAHDISLSLQRKVENFSNVERAFVHVDYLPREYDEHKDPTLRAYA